MPLSFGVSNSILELVGATPIVELSRIPEPDMADMFLKLEQFNPTGSHKDRIARKILEDAERGGTLLPGGTVVEASCGSFAASLALVCAVRGYKFVAVMPDSVTPEHISVVRAYGAAVELTPAKNGIAGAVRRAKEIASNAQGVFMPHQYENAANWRAQAQGAGAELAAAIRQDGRKADGFAMTVGTGGTLRGVSEVLRVDFPDVRIVAVRSQFEPMLEWGSAPEHAASWSAPPGARTVEVTQAMAWAMTRRLAREEGLLVGISSGANVVAALQLARELGPGKSVYTLCCDTGERYFSIEARFP